jgi:hypothetical protein
MSPICRTTRVVDEGKVPAGAVVDHTSGARRDVVHLVEVEAVEHSPHASVLDGDAIFAVHGGAQRTAMTKEAREEESMGSMEISWRGCQ